MVELGRLLTAMVTPFAPDGSAEHAEAGAVDYACAKRLATALLDSGSDGLVVAATTGESPTLTHEEKLRLFSELKREVGERGAIVASVGTNSTATSVELAREAEPAGVDALIAVTPYYNKPTQEGLERHFTAIAGATSLPVMLYNVPSRTGVNMSAETTLRLSAVDNIVGIKEASGDLAQITKIIEGAPNFRVWSGSDEDTFAIVKAGGYGAVAVISHLVGRQVRSMIEDAVAGRLAEAGRTHERLLPLIDALFLVANPMPVKYALNQLGFAVGAPRLPLCEPDAATAERIMAEVRRHQIDLPVAV
ncbi:MAG: 4-hydroxy-tetrahydrodipicolinate synthase [Dehalococcoidia bacterium]